MNTRSTPHLDDVGGEASVEPDPVTGWDHADSRHAAEEAHPDEAPVVAEVTGVDLGAEDSQDERQHRQQVDLAPELGDRSQTGVRLSRKSHVRIHSILS